MAKRNNQIKRIRIDVRFGAAPEFTVDAFEKPASAKRFRTGGDGPTENLVVLKEILRLVDDVYGKKDRAAICVEGTRIVRRSRCGA